MNVVNHRVPRSDLGLACVDFPEPRFALER